MSDTETARLSVGRISLEMGEVSKVQRLRSFATPQGRLHLVQKPQRVELFDGRQVRVAEAGKDPKGSRTIALSVSGPTGEYHLPLAAGEAAQLMFEIGYALERAAQGARSH